MLRGLALPWQMASLPASSVRSSVDPACEDIRCQLGAPGQGMGVGPAWTGQEREVHPRKGWSPFPDHQPLARAAEPSPILASVTRPIPASPALETVVMATQAGP